MTTSELVLLSNPLAALVVGVLSSLHCVGMCGPLGCALLASRQSGGTKWGLASYQFGRLASYSLVGGLAGFMGSKLFGLFGGIAPQVVTFALVAALLAMLLRLTDRWPRWPKLREINRKAMGRIVKTPPSLRGLCLGLATPLIPCGILYAMIGVGALAGSFGRGAAILGCFCLGTQPLLVSSLVGYRWVERRTSLNLVRRLQFWGAFLAICVLLVRSFIDLEALLYHGDLCISFSMKGS